MDNNFKNIFKKYLDGNCSDQEIEELLLSLKDASNSSSLHEMIEEELKADESSIPSELLDKIDKIVGNVELSVNSQIRTNTVSAKNVRTFPWKRIAIAASILLAIGISIIYNSKNTLTDEEKAIETAVSILADTSSATLTLADGKIITFDQHVDSLNAANNLTATTLTPVEYQTLTIPRSRQFKIVLEDGTAVWLNASSKLTYPNRFVGTTREVILEGEAYFEVKTDPQRTFIVKSKYQDVKVLGTHFNINSYPDQKTTKTTLLEGKVSVINTNSSIQSVLKPGQQASMSLESMNIEYVDVQNVISWKSGFFDFQDKYIHEMLADIGRWYDVEIEYSDKTPEMQFFGKIRRSSSLAEVLEILKDVGLKFKFEAPKTLIIKEK